MHSSASEHGEPIDPVLVGRLRQGDVDASLVLWRRHASAADALARRHLDDPSSAAAVNRAFAQVVREIAADRDPVAPFALYLRATLEREVGIPLESRTTEHTLLRAFRRLRGSYQTLLWYSTVEPMPFEEIAVALDHDPADLPVILRQAVCLLKTEWVAETVAATTVPDTCAWLLLRVEVHDAGMLGELGDQRYSRHLGGCAVCRGAVDDLGRLPQVLRDVVDLADDHRSDGGADGWDGADRWDGAGR